MSNSTPASSLSSPPAKRFTEIDIAKGIAIFLVVWGHVVAKGKHPEQSEWYQYTKDTVYLFHMPFFMFLSGLVAGIYYKPLRSIKEWGAFVFKKGMRLIPAYVLFGLIIVSAKLLLAPFFRIDNLPPSFLGGIQAIFLYPEESSAGFLWFIYVLFLFYLTLHPLMYIVRHLPIYLVGVGCMIYGIEAPKLCMLFEYVRYFLFFFLGVWGGMHYSSFFSLIKKYGLFTLLIFMILASIAVPFHIPKLVLGLSALPALFYLSNWISSYKTGKWFHQLGLMSFPIYLLNTISIGLTKAIGLKLTTWDGTHFFFFAPLLCLAGITLPILIRKYVFCRIPCLETITR
jgi:fucose 4-O-acetylase-like acetyltransferase